MLTSVTGDWTWHLPSTSYEHRTALALLGPAFCVKTNIKHWDFSFDVHVKLIAMGSHNQLLFPRFQPITFFFNHFFHTKIILVVCNVYKRYPLGLILTDLEIYGEIFLCYKTGSEKSDLMRTQYFPIFIEMCYHKWNFLKFALSHTIFILFFLPWISLVFRGTLGEENQTN